MSKRWRILLLNGPNLNLLGKREPSRYGGTTLPQLVDTLHQQAMQLGATLNHMQTNAEHLLVEAVQQATETADFILINPAALTHTSLSLRDAFLAVQIPFIEIHVTNIYMREPFRHRSYLTDIAVGTIAGCGELGYSLALQAAMHHLQH